MLLFTFHPVLPLPSTTASPPHFSTGCHPLSTSPLPSTNSPFPSCLISLFYWLPPPPASALFSTFSPPLLHHLSSLLVPYPPIASRIFSTFSLPSCFTYQLYWFPLSRNPFPVTSHYSGSLPSFWLWLKMQYLIKYFTRSPSSYIVTSPFHPGP